MMRASAGIGVLLLIVWAVLGANLESYINRTEKTPLALVTQRAQALHDASWVADLHSDSLLFGRDLRKRSNVGHVDLPRLAEGGVSFQIFGAPTQTPWNLNFERTDGNAFDALTLAGIAQLSPFAWRGPLGRALHMAKQLHNMAKASDGQFVVVRTQAQFAELRRRQESGSPVIGGLLAIEGAHAAESTPEGLERLFAAGYRMIGLAHFFDNNYAGSAHGIEKGGLTPLGRRTIERMESLGIVIDLAHLSPAAIDETLEMAQKPVVVSHGGPRKTCDNLRTLSDAHIRGIAATGGVIGVGYFDGSVCGNTPKHVATAIRAIVDLVGDDHAALGSDFDGAILPGFDTRHLPNVTQALLDEGVPPASVQKILGGNLQRVLEVTLP